MKEIERFSKKKGMVFKITELHNCILAQKVFGLQISGVLYLDLLVFFMMKVRVSFNKSAVLRSFFIRTFKIPMMSQTGCGEFEQWFPINTPPPHSNTHTKTWGDLPPTCTAVLQVWKLCRAPSACATQRPGGCEALVITTSTCRVRVRVRRKLWPSTSQHQNLDRSQDTEPRCCLWKQRCSVGLWVAGAQVWFHFLLHAQITILRGGMHGGGIFSRHEQILNRLRNYERADANQDMPVTSSQAVWRQILLLITCFVQCVICTCSSYKDKSHHHTNPHQS